MELGMGTEMAVSALFCAHKLELGHKSSYFRSTSRLDLCPLPESVNFIQYNIPYNGNKKSSKQERKSCLVFVDNFADNSYVWSTSKLILEQLESIWFSDRKFQIISEQCFLNPSGNRITSPSQIDTLIKYTK